MIALSTTALASLEGRSAGTLEAQGELVVADVGTIETHRRRQRALHARGGRAAEGLRKNESEKTLAKSARAPRKKKIWGRVDGLLPNPQCFSSLALLALLARDLLRSSDGSARLGGFGWRGGSSRPRSAGSRASRNARASRRDSCALCPRPRRASRTPADPSPPCRAGRSRGSSRASGPRARARPRPCPDRACPR